MCTNKKLNKAKEHLFKTLATWNTYELMTLQIMIKMKATKVSRWTLMGEIDKTLHKKMVILLSVMVALWQISWCCLIFSAMSTNATSTWCRDLPLWYKCNFNMMLRLATMVLLEETKLNHKHWVLLQRKWILDHWILSLD